MVIQAEEDDRRLWQSQGLSENPTTSTWSTRSKPPQSRLHNFSFPTLSWGSQKLLRCMKGRSFVEEFQTSSSSSPKDPQPQPQPQSNPSRPWNLRSRRGSRNGQGEVVLNRNPSPSSPLPSSSHSILQKEKPVIVVMKGLEKSGRREFSIALSREEIEEDFLLTKGAKPPRRPKKRAKYVQRQLDALFPGVLLAEVTTDLYKIEEQES